MVTFILCCVLCVLVVALIEAHEQAKRIAWIRKDHNARMVRAFDELNAIEAKVLEMVRYGD